MNDNLKNEEYEEVLLEVKDASLLLDKYIPGLDENDKFFFIEFILWGLRRF